VDAPLHRGGRVTPSLDAILHDDFEGLRAARRAEDQRIIDYVAGLTEHELGRTLCYRTISRSEEIGQERRLALPHVFNHQTHHRGQLHCLLISITGDAPPLDLILCQRETGAGLS
jgi:uncharacterized damage-inducible protein DinB